MLVNPEKFQWTPKLTLIIIFLYPSFNYHPLVWHFYSAKPQNKTKKIQEWALRILYDDYQSDYTTLIKKSRRTI